MTDLPDLIKTADEIASMFEGINKRKPGNPANVPPGKQRKPIRTAVSSMPKQRNCPCCKRMMVWDKSESQWWCFWCKSGTVFSGELSNTTDSVRSALLAMSKKEYTMFAKFVRHMRKHDGGDEATIKLFVDMAVAWFKHDNPNFNEGMFRTACGE